LDDADYFLAVASRPAIRSHKPVEVPVPNSKYKPNPVRIEPVEMPSPPFPIILSMSKDRLSPNGEGFVFGQYLSPIILSTSNGRLSPNGVGVVSRI
jgi:hypothetical protein